MAERLEPVCLEHLENSGSGTFYAPATGADFDSVKVEFQPATTQEVSVGAILLAPLMRRLGEGVELTPKEEKILADPESMGGANVDYIANRVRYGYGPTALFKKLKENIL